MAVAGIDVGFRTIKAVVMEDGRVLSQSTIMNAEDASIGAKEALDKAIALAGLRPDDVKCIVSTGNGRKDVTFAHKNKGSPSCLAKGALSLFPSVRTVIDIGAESCTVLGLNEQGMVNDMVTHSKCASGTGTFLETLAKVMNMPLEEMAKLSLKSQKEAEITVSCTIFAEQEVISHIHRQPPTPVADIVAGIHASVAHKTAGLCKQVGIKPDVVLVGGVARNVGFVKILKERLGVELKIPQDPETVAALGAAIIAKENI